MTSIALFPGIAAAGRPRIPYEAREVGIMVDRVGRPRGESWKRRPDGRSSSRWRPAGYGLSEQPCAMTERQLLECFVTSNDPDAFAALIERHGPMVLAVCRSVLREQHDVEDAFQETFLILARDAGTITHSETIGPWLRRVALRRAQRVLFQAARRRVRERNRTDSRAEYRTDPFDFSLIPLLREEVSHLPEHYRRPVVLCYLEGKTHQEAAAQLRCPIGTIKGQLSRARQVLRNRLSRRGLDPSVESLERPLEAGRRPINSCPS
jgi:RNA polymerase sigma factor (sigma-70 family)